MFDERDITRGLSIFARIIDAKNWDHLSDVFADDLSFDYGSGGEQQGIEALSQNMRRFLDVCGRTQHLIGSILIDINGDQASSRAYVQARHQAIDAQAGAPAFDTNGEYIDQWERRTEGWRIIRRDAIWFNLVGSPTIISAENL